jgi:hypothetical protein
MELLRSTGTFLFHLLLSAHKNPFLVHAILEIPASVNFFLNPSGQLRIYSPHAHAVIRQYAVLLLSSVIVSLLFFMRNPDELSGQVAGAFLIYHLAPVVRATGRLRRNHAVWQPLLFLASHGVCFAGLMGWCWNLYLCKLLFG